MFITDKMMRKIMKAAAPILVLALLGSAVWPTVRPDVELGDNVYETIWLWRIPAYANNPSWRVRWSWSDPLRAQARCCRALSGPNSAPGENLRILLSADEKRT
jgi:hypothetical protein